uniref:Uncharacterized protein n=1 Tax=Oryza punctata TaxID=4537 RepID=A0A0E0JXV0_ORYPU
MDLSPRPPTPPHVVLVTSPCAGYVIPMAELARRIVSRHDCAATLVTFSGLAASLDARAAAVLASLLASSVAAVTLPEVTLDDVPADANFGTLIFKLVHRSLPSLREFLRSTGGGGGGVAALVPDFFCGVVLDLAVELGVPGYVFVPSNIASLAFMRRFDEVRDGAASGEYRDLPDPLRLAADMTIRVADMPDGYLDRSNPVFWQLLEEVRQYRRADGFLVNNFAEMEPTIVEEFKKAAEKGTFPQVHPVGLFVRPSSDEAGDSACLEWLDRQPAGSVVYVSFGRENCICATMHELAAGLEMSGHRFLWIVRMPNDDGESYDFGTSQRDDNDDDRGGGGGHEDDRWRGFPTGSWRGRGTGVRVLSHRATAAFVSHCGWNSALESVSAGVPMMAWPLYAEQKVNAVILMEVAGLALRPAVARGGDGVVTREEVTAAVKELMDLGEKGSAARRQARELQAAVARARSPDGASHRALTVVANKWKNAVHEEPSGMDPSPRPPPPHVVLVSSPCAGHVMPMAELARRLVAFHGCAATLVTFSGLAASLDARSAAVIASLPASSVAAVTLPEVALDDVPAGASFDTLIFELVRRSLPSLREFLRSISGGVAALVPDLFCGVVLDLAAELGIPRYLFLPSNVASLACMRRLVELHDGAAPGEYRDFPDPLHLAGDVTISVADLPIEFLDRSNPVFGQLIDEGRRHRRADGFLVNSFAEMEPTIVEDFKKAAEEGAFPPVYPVGPFVRSSSNEIGESACLEWLDRQPAGSVVYVSFGSAGMLSVEQTRELAAGLEISGHRFLWVVRMPSLDSETYDFGTGGGGGGHDDDPLAWLPDGFLERTRGRGLAVASWTPQVRVLSHPGMAAFVSHCGWNSALESVSAGVPMMAWPLYAEQKVNAVILTEVAGVALRPAAARGGDGVVTREEVAAAVKELMDPGEKGNAARRRAKELQAAAARARSPDGASHRELDEVAGKWKQTTVLRTNNAV